MTSNDRLVRVTLYTPEPVECLGWEYHKDIDGPCPQCGRNTQHSFARTRYTITEQGRDYLRRNR